jgi:TonB family protein
MKAALLYRPRRRWLFWIAFACAVGLHVGAMVIAQGKTHNIVAKEFEPAGVDVEVLEPEQPSVQEAVMPPVSEQAPPDQDAFPEENSTPPPVRPRKKTRAAIAVRTADRGAVAPFGSLKAMVMYAPRPVYPYEARRQRTTGSGIALLTVDPASGNVTDARMTHSCGSVILDSATLSALRAWRFKPGTAGNIQVPITYTLAGASY